MSDASPPATPSAMDRLRASLFDIRVIRVLIQIIFLLGVLVGGAALISNTQRGLARLGLVPSFGFLNAPSNVPISEGPIPHTAADTFGHAFVVGIVNTLRAVVVGLIGTTILGLIVGVARLSSNWLTRTLSLIFIEIMQNTPLLLQLIFLYAGVFLALPPARESIQLPGPSYLSVRGLATPALIPTTNITLWTVIVLGAVILGVTLYRRLRKQGLESGARTYAFEIGLLIPVITLLVATALFAPYTVSYPEIIGPRYAPGAGSVVSPEYVAIVVGLILYTGAYTAEVVRSGIQSVSQGQWEAARSQGFSYFQTLRLIILPQALRVMIPPLTNQYLNLIKNSSLAGVVGFADVFGVGKTALESGQTVPVVIIVMLIYLVMDLTTAFVMNILNQRVQIKAR